MSTSSSNAPFASTLLQGLRPFSGGSSFAEDARIVGDGVAMERLRTQIQRLGPHFRTVLVTGETGTGKELTARELHRFSPQADGPFVVFNAASVGAAVVEWQGSTESLPTAAGDLDSLLEAARGGSLYFDQVGEMPVALQTQLLEQLLRRERSFRASRGTPRMETRILASTSQDLRGLAAHGRFREDLYYRIATVEIGLPPLRERMEDLPALVGHFLRCYAERCDYGLATVTQEAMDCLMEYSWPGNVRELENLVGRVCLETGSFDAERVARVLDATGFAGSSRVSGHTMRLQQVVEQHVLQVLKLSDGNKVRAAELLGISRSTLYRMLDAVR